MSSSPVAEVVSRMVGQRLNDVVVCGWLERGKGQTKFFPDKRTIDFVLESGTAVFRGDETALTARDEDGHLLHEDQQEHDYDYREELGEPCSASIFHLLSFFNYRPLIVSAHVYIDSRTEGPEAVLFVFQSFHLFLQLDLDEGLHLTASDAGEASWRDWRARTGEGFRIVSFREIVSLPFLWRF